MGLLFYKVACSRCGLPSNNSKREMVLKETVMKA
jgi:hypothetical protein